MSDPHAAAPRVASIHPVPTVEEAVAIAAAVEVGWPRLVVSDGDGSAEPSRWRFSGRWWSRPVAVASRPPLSRGGPAPALGQNGRMELTTVADDHAVVHDGLEVRVYDDLQPDTVYEYDGFVFRTLARPAGERLATFATVNDVHFGETECGVIEGLEVGPTFRVPDGAEPYPEMMNRGAIHEIEQVAPDAVVVKGDLTSEGTVEQYRTFLEFYEEAFGDVLTHVRGNHESLPRRRPRRRAHPAGRPPGRHRRPARHVHGGQRQRDRHRRSAGVAARPGRRGRPARCW